MDISAKLNRLSETLSSTAQDLNDYANQLRGPIPEVKCPRCRSTDFTVVTKNINRAGFIMGGPLLGISNKTEAVCHKCGKHFKI